MIASLFTDRFERYWLRDVRIVMISAMTVSSNYPIELMCEILLAH